MTPAQEVADKNRCQRGGVKERSLRIGEQRPAAVSIGVPERQLSRTECIGDKGRQRIVKITKVPRDDISGPEEHFAEKDEDGSQQYDVRDERAALPGRHRPRLASGRTGSLVP